MTTANSLITYQNVDLKTYCSFNKKGLIFKYLSLFLASIILLSDDLVPFFPFLNFYFGVTGFTCNIST